MTYRKPSGRLFRPLARARVAQRPRTCLALEPLELRAMLDGAGASSLSQPLVVGRSLSAYFAGDVADHREAITYTVYNAQPDPESGVLLTTTLAPGVTVADASLPPDRSGQALAWSLGTIPGYGRASVTLTLTLPVPLPALLDAGARVFATLDGGPVSAAAPAAALRAGTADPALLAATPDANAADPFVQQQAAALGYDPQRIFDYLHDQVGYNSYIGSVRGARGTLWSGAGNALDVASLGVALLRASGIPARYASGTLPQDQSRALIRSMFPPAAQTVGYVPPGATTADPANDATLLAETTAHDWFQFDAGSGFQDADPLLPGAVVGRAFAAPASTFAEVPDSRREKAEVRLTAEFYDEVSGLFGDGLSRQVVLDRTFNDVDLVGHPITIGNDVGYSGSGLGITEIVYTYTPYLRVGDAADPDPAADEIVTGDSYQELYTDYDLGGQQLTGLFADVTLSGPQGAPTTASHAIFDRIGYASRRVPTALFLTPEVGTPPAFLGTDATTIDVLPGLQSPAALGPQASVAADAQARLAAFGSAPDPDGTAVAQVAPLVNELGVAFSRFQAESLAWHSDLASERLAAFLRTASYFDRPRVVVTSQSLVPDPGGSGAGLAERIDLLLDTPRALAAPGQVAEAAASFQAGRGLADNALESAFTPVARDGDRPLTVLDIFDAAAAQGVPLVRLSGAEDVARLDALGLGPDANARIADALADGWAVIVPAAPVTLDGAPEVGWLQSDPATGYVTGVLPDGYHPGEGGDLDLPSLELGMSEGATVEKGVYDAARIARILLRLFDTERLAGIYQSILRTGNVAKAIQASGAAGRLAGAVLKEALSKALIVLAGKEQFENNNAAGAAALFKLAYDVIAHEDPPVAPALFDADVRPAAPAESASVALTAAPGRPAGAVSGTGPAASLSVAGSLVADWGSTAATTLPVTSLIASGATVLDASGRVVGTGAVAAADAAGVEAVVTGSNRFHVEGSGSLSFYGPAGPTLGASGDWASLSAAVTGAPTITLTTSGLTLDGRALPAGAYTIRAASATLAGGGRSAAPSFSGSVSLAATGATVTLGAGGAFAVGGRALDPARGAALTGYSGRITVAAGSGDQDAVTLDGSAGAVLQVRAPGAPRPADQNTPATFAVALDTSAAGPFHLYADAPTGWSVSVDPSGNVAITPAPGLQAGTYPIRLVAQSDTDPNLLAQATATITVGATAPGMTLAVLTDPLLTVPYAGAELPTAFQAQVHNSGPVADTYTVQVTGTPAGFGLQTSGSTLNVPAGQTGILGLYLTPDGGPVPPAGTSATFKVTAASTTDPGLSRTTTGSFTVPVIHAVGVATDAGQLAAASGQPATVHVTFTNRGNTTETLAPTAQAPAGLVVAGLAPLTLAPGQSSTQALTLTPTAGPATGSRLAVTLGTGLASAGGSGPATAQVVVTVRSPQTLAVQQAADAAATGDGPTSIAVAPVISNLADTLDQLRSQPSDHATLDRTGYLLAQLDALLQSDPTLAPLVADLRPVESAAAAGNVAALLTTSGPFFAELTRALAAETAQGFTIAATPSRIDVETGGSGTVPVVVTNTGTEAETIALAVGPLPDGVTATLGRAQVTLAPGASATVSLAVSNTLDAAKAVNIQVNGQDAGFQQATTVAVSILPAVADVLGVTITPNSPASGAAVSVSARVFNTANAARTVTAQLDLVDTSGAVLKALGQADLGLTTGAGDMTADLGQVATAGLAPGVYGVRVSLRAADGSAIPGRTATGYFVAGQPVVATAAASPSVLPPGTSTVTTAITLTLNAGSSGDPGATTVTAQATVPGSANPYLAGMPDGTPSTGGDVAPDESPPIVAGLPLNPGDALTFDVAGSVDYGGSQPTDPPDGRRNSLFYHQGGAEHGLSGLYAPINALLGVFLGPDQPSLAPAPPDLDFTTTPYADYTQVPGAWNYSSLAPQLQQVFVIGDGRTDDGQAQPIIVPAGATRLVLGTMDGYGWYNNTGNFSVAVHEHLTGVVGQSYHVTDDLPASGYSVDPASISPGATAVSPAQVAWDASPPVGPDPVVFQLGGQVAGLAPGEVRQVSAGVNVEATVQLSDGQTVVTTLPLGPLSVAAQHIIGLSPTETSAPKGGAATYTVTLTNPLPTAVTYTLTTDGLDGLSSTLAATVTVGPGATLTTPLALNVPLSATAGDRGFSVIATAAGGAADSVAGRLTVTSTVALPTESVSVMLRPTTASAGPQTPATYLVTVVNTGDATATFELAGAFPAGFAADLSESSLTLAPGAASARTVRLALTPPAGAAAGDVPFSINATSHDAATVHGTASGTVHVVRYGVGLSLAPASGPAGSTFQLMVTNTGSVADTFAVALGGPAGAAATLGVAQVTLAPGASQVVPVRVGDLGFTLPGPVALVATATSRSDSTIRGAARATVTAPATAGLSAGLSPEARVLPIPGTTNFVVLVNNRGNVGDTYTVSIAGTEGPVSAGLLAPGGSRTAAVPRLALPALSGGALVLDASLLGLGRGAITVRVSSRSDPSRTAAVTARVSASAAASVTLTAAPNPATVGQAVALTAVVAAPAGVAEAPSGTVTFLDNGQPIGTAPVGAGGRAVLTTTALAAGAHALTASYAGDTRFDAASSAAVVEQVNAPVMPPTPTPTPTPTPAPVPAVASLARFGFHAQPTALVLGFTAALDTARAQDVSNYRIVLVSGRAPAGVRLGQAVPVKAAIYDAATQTVTLRPAIRLNIHDTYVLTVSANPASGLAGASGVALAGAGDGVAGRDYTAQITRQLLAGRYPAPPRPIVAHPARAAAARRPLAALAGTLALRHTPTPSPKPSARARMHGTSHPSPPHNTPSPHGR